MDEKRILVTGIGGNVGQGILRNIRASKYPVKLIGANTDAFSAGNHLCDSFYKVPYAVSEDYLPTLLDIVKTESVDLIIPSTDFEVYHLAKNKEAVLCEVAVSTFNTAQAFIDKYETYLQLKAHDIPFAASCLPSEYKDQFEECIVKPKQGRGSRGLAINPEKPQLYSDDEYVVQDYHKGIEITTAFYVTKSNQLHGFITFERHLQHGATTHCKVDFNTNPKVEKILKALVEHFEIKGSANLQSIVTQDGRIIPFEVNCRISGTNSIRSNFGFKDVDYTIKEWLYDEPLPKVAIKKGVATRLLMDVIYPDSSDFSEVVDGNTKHFLY